MCEERITRAKVRCGDAHLGERGDIGPADLAANGTARESYESEQTLVGHRRRRRRRPIDDLDGVALFEGRAKKSSQPIDRLIERAVRHVGYDVGRNAALNTHRLKLFDEGDTVDERTSRLISGDLLEQGAESVHRVSTREGTCRVCSFPLQGHDQTKRGLTAHLNAA